jgi:deoxyribodipyrimidine photo-lyase
LAWAAGTGCDAAPILEYLTRNSTKKLTKKGVYIRKWIKEFDLGYENLW